jgi:hypothetical protein
MVPEHIHSIVVSVGLLFIAIAGSMIDQPAALQPIQVAGVPTYDLYISLAHEPEDYFVLNYPTGLFSQADGHRVGGDSSLIRYAAWHNKRTIGGAGPFYNPLLLNRMSAGGFLNPLTLDEGEWSESASALNEAVVTWRIGAVVVHPDLLDEESLTGLSDYLAQVESLCSPVNRDGLVYYRPIWHPEGCPES